MVHLFLFATFATVSLMVAQDLLLVGLAIIGWCYVARLIARRDAVCGDVAWFGVVLLGLGGVAGVGWTFFQGWRRWDVAWLGGVLFPLLCSGFIFLCWAAWRGLRRVPAENSGLTWGAPIALSVLTLGVAAGLESLRNGQGWFWTLLTLTTLANLAAIAQLIRRAWTWHAPLAAGLFALHICTVLTLAGLSGGNLGGAWGRQSLNLFSQLAFVAAAVLLYRQLATDRWQKVSS